MSRNRGARRQARRNKLIAMRAELCILLENRLHPDHLKLNTQDTQELLDGIKTFDQVPLKFSGQYVKRSTWWDETRVMPDDLKGLPKLLNEQVFEDAVEAFDTGVNEALLSGTGIVRLTTSQHSGTIMDMDSGNASGHDT